MDTKKLTWIVAILLVLALFWEREKEQQPAQAHPKAEEPPHEPRKFEPSPSAQTVKVDPGVKPHEMPPPTPPVAQVVKSKSDSKKLALPYKLYKNLFIVQGDVIAGAVPKGETPDPEGLVAMDPLKLWPSSTIPFHIQPDLPNPERVLQALQLFEGTVIKFVKYENTHERALVFENGEQHCYSYVGHTVAKQPILISPRCSPSDIAHEILHALGFVHEQNRTDRDTYLDVRMDNVEEPFKINFEKLPPDFMKVSGLGEFDYQSLMIYTPDMFAKPGQVTMEPRSRDKLINPSPGLSAGDIDRLNRAYRGR